MMPVLLTCQYHDSRTQYAGEGACQGTMVDSTKYMSFGCTTQHCLDKLEIGTTYLESLSDP
jgi:hypothetical protein